VSLGIPFFLWVGIFNLTVIAQFWSFAADVYSPEEGKRLLPILGIGSSVGALVGAAIAGLLFRLGPYNLMLIASAILMVCLALTYVAHRRESARARGDARAPEEPIGGENGFALMAKDKYLLLVGLLIFVLNAVNKTGEYVFDRALLAEAGTEAAALGVTASQYIGKFKAEYFEYVNVAAVAMQLFAVSRIIKYIGVKRALFIMPIVSLAGYGGLAFVPILAVALVAKVAENGLDYSLANTAQQALWLVTTREAKYKVKQVIDTFLVRSGDVLSAGLVWFGTHLVAFDLRSFVVANVAMTVVWAFVVWRLTRRYAERAA
jgi:AAA family ATP:ADP antiporter